MPRSSRALRRFNYLLSETDAAYHEAASRLGLADSVMQILYAVYDSAEGDRCPLSEVCRCTGISKQTINSALRKLEADGVVRLERAGGRNKDVCLTQRGMALARSTAAKIIEAEDAVLASWPAQDVEAYLSLTERYLTAFREEIKNWDQ